MSISFSPCRCPSPPPPMPSPVLVPTSLHSPPPLTKKPSRSHFSASVKKTLNHALSHDALYQTPKPFRFGDDPLEPALPSVRTIKRTLSHLPSRCRSPPPSPAVRCPPPPVPPIPAFVLTTNHSAIRHKPSLSNRAPTLNIYLDRSREDSAKMRCESKAGGTLTCMQFLAVHSQTGQCGA